MSKTTFRFIAALTIASSLGVSLPKHVEAGAIPWTYNAIFGYGPMFPRRHGYTAGYSPMYSGMNIWGANYGQAYSANYGPSMGWSPSVTSYYGPSYYGGGSVYSSASCGCNPCGVSACDPCGGNSGCPNGNCASTEGTYSPAPVKNNGNNSSEVTPTFKPTSPEKVAPDPADDFVPVDRRESEFVSPRSNSTIPNTPTNLGTDSTIPDNLNSNGNGTSTIPMSPIERPMAPGNNTESTIPNINNRSTIPENNSSTIPENTRSTIPENPASREFPPPISRPAPTEPSSNEVIPGNTNVEPLELELIPVARVVVERKRVSMKAGYRIPIVSRIDVPTDRILEAGSSNLAIR
ncbi:hypothetical protein OAF98_02385 [Planctomicrobium sp.]|jgi:hypothetical protein|nr:hypothetical protein [Planctomicrobium sp.]MBT5018430.1 hypothetical protein [Planctomicrobium sp.]MDA7503632.1 hypothetical protein [bacterium]MDB4731799.1 hypothetical protein [bacterium]MDB4743309.1 hypothetical protein [Planctomicrobium sp.]